MEKEILGEEEVVEYRGRRMEEEIERREGSGIRDKIEEISVQRERITGQEEEDDERGR